jgi:hypothetical protein
MEVVADARRSVRELPDERLFVEWWESGSSEAALKAEGLGTFQARVVATRAVGQDHYASEADPVSQLFEGFAAERQLMERVNERLANEFALEIKPWRGYVPAYLDGQIVYSFKPMTKGLYVGVLGDDLPFETIAHKSSRGGSERMTRGFFATDKTTTVENLRSVIASVTGTSTKR